MSDFINETQWDLQEFVDMYNKWVQEQKAKNNQPKEANEYFAKSQDAYNNKNFNLALNYINQAIQIYPESALGYLYRAKTYSAMERYQDAIRDYSKCISLDNNNVEAYYGRGVLLYEEYRMYQQCINGMDEIISRNNNIGELYFLRGIAKTALYGDTTGCPDLKRAYELGVHEAQEVMLRYCK